MWCFLDLLSIFVAAVLIGSKYGFEIGFAVGLLSIVFYRGSD